MEQDIQLLELADGIKDALINSGFLTIRSVLGSTMADISSKLGVDPVYSTNYFSRSQKDSSGND